MECCRCALISAIEGETPQHPSLTDLSNGSDISTGAINAGDVIVAPHEGCWLITQNIEQCDRAQSTEHRAQSTEHSTQITELRAYSKGQHFQPPLLLLYATALNPRGLLQRAIFSFACFRSRSTPDSTSCHLDNFFFCTFLLAADRTDSRSSRAEITPSIRYVFTIGAELSFSIISGISVAS